MFDVKKLVEAILAFVNFFVVRIAVTCFVAMLVYKMSGQYYFDLVGAYISESPFSEQDLKSYIAKASEYVSDTNVKSTIFVVALIGCLSLLDILYRFVGMLAGLLPVGMLYKYQFGTDQSYPAILETWRRYTKQYTPFLFIALVEDKARDELWKKKTDRWWNTLFRYSKSFIVIILILYFLTPRGALKVSLLDIFYYAALALICMAVCTAIESARVANDMYSALRIALQTLDHEAKDTPIADAEYREATKTIFSQRPTDSWRQRWSGKFWRVRLSVVIPYIVTDNDLGAAVRELKNRWNQWRSGGPERQNTDIRTDLT